jgi:CheY-like chemotaxis protein
MGSQSGPIIVLEDDIDEKEILEQAIKKCGLMNEIKFFSSGDVFLDYLRSTADRPFIILSDVNLPRMGGMETKRVINGEDFLRRKSIPFIFLSTNASPGAVEEAYDLTVQGYFLKQNSMAAIEKSLRLIFEYWKECKHTNSD